MRSLLTPHQRQQQAEDPGPPPTQRRCPAALHGAMSHTEPSGRMPKQGCALQPDLLSGYPWVIRPGPD